MQSWLAVDYHREEQYIVLKKRKGCYSNALAMKFNGARPCYFKKSLQDLKLYSISVGESYFKSNALRYCVTP